MEIEKVCPGIKADTLTSHYNSLVSGVRKHLPADEFESLVGELKTKGSREDSWTDNQNLALPRIVKNVEDGSVDYTSTGRFWGVGGVLRWDSRGGSRSGPRDPDLQKPWIPGKDLGPGQIPQIYSTRLKFFCSDLSCRDSRHARCFPSLFEEFFFFSKRSFSKNTLQGLSRGKGDVGARESLLPAPNYNTPVKDLSYKDLLTSTFTLRGLN